MCQTGANLKVASRVRVADQSYRAIRHLPRCMDALITTQSRYLCGVCGTQWIMVRQLRRNVESTLHDRETRFLFPTAVSVGFTVPASRTHASAHVGQVPVRTRGWLTLRETMAAVARCFQNMLK